MAAHAEIYELLGNIRASVNADSTCEQLADIAVCCREAEDRLNDVRKEVTKLKEYTEKLCCLKYLEDAPRMMRKQPIRTEYVTANPDIKTFAKIPSYEKDPANYEKLMTYLGIDPCLWDRGRVLTELGEEHTEVAKIHWPGFTSLITRLKAQGLPLPDGIDPEATYYEYTLRMRKKGEILKNDAQPMSKVDDSEIPF